MDTLEDLLAEAAAAPVDGWDFSWFDGRALEERPPWGYARRLGERLRTATAALDVQTGGGEVLRTALTAAGTVPATVAATESWPPNIALARAALAPFGGVVEEAADDGSLPFPADTFDLVSSRHPTVAGWAEIARVLAPGGTYFAQHVGVGTAAAVTDFMMGPQPVGDGRSVQRARDGARAAGLEVVDVREATLKLEFYDVAAVAVYLRKVIWIVPDFTIARYRPQLAAMHEHIGREGAFRASTARYLIECRKPHTVTGR
ncbi:methyltransferase domain-containing protein [Dactylosporangium matsuzakiense]|uniref:Methyltransferase type 11 n=1 Tax=Dactylosporangium matsuzakiense TaxID=53360 RepID=A0A9W6KZB2_9ACTN|nr:methyltransferase domain-containing protein [Dactylosporangium matsuzakiense]UWZ49048.1 methyltransferase domain-containing protein [Dactylosporangium matsuzakiense]GLL08214.1 methyltransferase type 11 [Dactylosporangium matsuzakiense]